MVAWFGKRDKTLKKLFGKSVFELEVKHLVNWQAFLLDDWPASHLLYFEISDCHN